jgi:VWFA-related protein
MRSDVHKVSLWQRVLTLAATAALLIPAAPAQQQQTTPPPQTGPQQSTQTPQQATPPQSAPPKVNTQQAPPPPPANNGEPGKNTIRAYTDLVQIDTTVTGKDGKLIKGLKRENFEIYEDDKLEKIDAVDYFDVEAIETAKKDDTAPIVVALQQANNPESLRPIVREHRMMILYFDLSSLQPEDLIRATDAAKKFVREQMSPADLVGVVSFGSVMRVNLDFTNNHDDLLKAIASLIPGKDSQLAGLAAATASAGDDSVTEDNGAAFTADDTEFNIFNTDLKLAAVEALCNMLGAIPGKKAVLQFTGGITQTGEENRSQLQASTNAANRNNVSLYSVDARGLLAETPGGDASTGMATGTSSFSGAAVFQQVQARQESRDTLATLAEDTGGKAFFDQGDFGKIFQEVESETTGYYLLNYYSTNPKRDGRYRRVRIKLVNVPGAHVKFREGYYAPKDWGIYSTEDREKQLDDAMASNVPLVELPIALQTAQFHMPNGQIFVPVSAKLASSALQWAEKRGSREAQFDFLAEVTDANSKRVASSLRDTMTVRLDTERFQQVQQQAMVYQGGFLLSPGKYHLKFLARENESGRVGTFEQDLTLLPANPNRLSLSTVMLSSQIVQVQKTAEVQRKALGVDTKMKESPLDVNGERIVPNVTGVFTEQQTLYVFFQAYLPANADAANLRAGLVFFQGGKQSNATAMVEPTEVDAKTRTASFRISIPLEKIPLGSYTVQAVAIVAGSAQAAFARSYFALRKPAAAASAPSGGPSGPGR